MARDSCNKLRVYMSLLVNDNHCRNVCSEKVTAEKFSLQFDQAYAVRFISYLKRRKYRQRLFQRVWTQEKLAL